jgi:peptidoglycan/xylan/chitin deacetylase (PgdA/CDA1 family)
VTSLLIVLLQLSHPAFADQANVFIYHRFADLRYPSTNVSLANFQAHLELLHQQKFVVLSLGEVVERLQNGKDLPPSCAVITVDDGYRSFLTGAWPLLKKYGFPVTLFVSTDTVGSGDYLDWQELKVLQGEGAEIGNHSASHAYLLDRLPAESALAWKARVSEDLDRSQQMFEQNLGAAPRLFAYPYGEFSMELVEVVKDAKFTAAFGQQSGVITAGQDLFTLPRFPIGGEHASLDEFRNKLFMKSLAVRVASPDNTLIDDANPPGLMLYLEQKDVDRNSLRCFVPGQSDCQVRQVDDDAGLYEIVASRPLDGRRSKYTLTASDMSGKTWYWFSHLWVRPHRND